MFGAAFDIQPTWQNTFFIQPALNTACHHITDLAQSCRDFLLRAIGTFIRPLHFGNTHMMGMSHRQHLFCIFKGIGVLIIFCLRRLIHLIITAYKAAADGIIHLMQQNGAIAIIGKKLHPIGMGWQSNLIIKNKIAFRVKGKAHPIIKRY